MFTESEIQYFKKNFADEMGGFAGAEKQFEKLKNLEFVQLPDSEAFDHYGEKLGVDPELMAFVKANFVIDPARSYEEVIKEAVRIGKEFLCIREKQH